MWSYEFWSVTTSFVVHPQQHLRLGISRTHPNIVQYKERRGKNHHLRRPELQIVVNYFSSCTTPHRRLSPLTTPRRGSSPLGHYNCGGGGVVPSFPFRFGLQALFLSFLSVIFGDDPVVSGGSLFQMESQAAGLRRVLLLSFCVSGIWAAYIYQGILQETVSTKRFGSDKKRFEHLAFLNLAQNVVCLIWSFLMIKILSRNANGGAPWWSYWSAGITNTIGPAMGIEALKYISYPAQAFSESSIERIGVLYENWHESYAVLAKSSKMIPVMLMGTLVYGIRYTFPEYLCTFLVAGGVSMFALLKTSSKTISKLASPNAPLGYALCFLNLAFDGFTNATQDSISVRYPKTNAWDIMLGMNLWGTIYNMIFMFGLPNAMGYDAIRFCRQHPEAAWDILLYCLCGAVGQNFIFLTISRFGSLTNTTITTTRKFVSIVVSSLLSGNPLSEKQWASVVMVFSGLSYQIYLKWKKSRRSQKKRKST
ncbi:UDP-galactose transporter 3 isoform 1 [Dorcoceras hygrometricum]|uniref:UDP-galactose transporter 3 isoform 1 n=1 Tax=Dorcoceras hygrometricum TaxID=472368 RepID=A0A2Z7CGW9_9LAMI|nr:UDP-galactose transporter 3 isoform 1 [Dorcoceras hygrometricum]